MAKVDLILDAQRSAWALSASHGSEADNSSRTRALYEKVLKRDDCVCQGCGWRSTRYQEIHPLDGNHRHRDSEDWVTLCPLCHQVFHLPQASSTGGGLLVWLPEMSQAHLNLLTIPLFVANRNPQHKFHKLSNTLLGTLRTRAGYVRAQFHDPDPMMLAQLIVKMTPEEHAQRGTPLRSLRLWAQAERFGPAIEHWETHTFKKWNDTDWEKALPSGYDVTKVLAQETHYG